MITNWLVRGDTHGRFEGMLNQLNDYNPLTTAIIILGDAGFNYYFNSRDDKAKEYVNNSGFRIYCVKGNHEARPMDVANMEIFYDEDVHGYIYMEQQYPNIRYFKEWGDYWLGCYHVAVIGGAYSVDKWWRLWRAGVQTKLDYGYNNPKKTGWFPNEQLSSKEMAQAQSELMGQHYDFVFSHTCPLSWQPTDLFLSAINQNEVDNSMEKWLDDFKDVIDWEIWLFGHYHQDRLERPHVEMYFNDIESLDVIFERWQNYDLNKHLNWWLNKSPNFYME